MRCRGPLFAENGKMMEQVSNCKFASVDIPKRRWLGRKYSHFPSREKHDSVSIGDLAPEILRRGSTCVTACARHLIFGAQKLEHNNPKNDPESDQKWVSRKVVFSDLGGDVLDFFTYCLVDLVFVYVAWLKQIVGGMFLGFWIHCLA